jgi:hypothetical protein
MLSCLLAVGDEGGGTRINGLVEGRDNPVRTLARVLAFLALLALAVGASPASAASYEPNDSISTATGPLLGGQGYVAQLETQSDKDVFYFYVTSPREAKVDITLEDMGGGSAGAYIGAALTDGLGTPVAATAFVNPGEARELSAQLKPQKYFLQVTPGAGFGDSYRVATGADGFGPYSAIAGRCAAARAATKTAGAAVRRAKLKLQRAVSRLRRALYGSDRARVAAQRAYASAKRRARAARRALKAAAARQAPWCSIPQ